MSGVRCPNPSVQIPSQLPNSKEALQVIQDSLSQEPIDNYKAVKSFKQNDTFQISAVDSTVDSQPAVIYSFTIPTRTVVQYPPVLYWQLTETASYIGFKTVHRLGLLTACWLENYCTIYSVHVMLTLLRDAEKLVMVISSTQSDCQTSVKVFTVLFQ